MMIFFFNDTATTEIYTLSLHDALPILIVYRPRRSDEHVAVDVFAIVGVGSLGAIFAVHPEIACTAITTKIIVTDHIYVIIAP